jgi:hypothetical protein
LDFKEFIVKILKLFVFLIALPLHMCGATSDTDWLIVGAGPAGMATIGVLLDIGVQPQRIVWLDPEFNVGNLSNFPHVPANNKMKEFIDFLVMCNTFKECAHDDIQAMSALNQNEHYTLDYIIAALRTITQGLRARVTAVQDCMASLQFTHDVWHISTGKGAHITAQHVVLATGSHPRTLDYGQNKIVALDVALNPHALAQVMSADDVVGVVGSAHSAILAMKFLCELATPVQRIINLYRHPIQYAVDMGTWVLSNAHSLKGIAAQWAQDVLEKNPPAYLTRVYSTDATLSAHLAECSKIIYAVGFERNELPLLNGTTPITCYNDTNGFIAPRLFGIGIAFPQIWTNQIGETFHRVGLNSFMEYAQKVIPQWASDELYKQATKQQFKAQLHVLRKAAELFAIYAL